MWPNDGALICRPDSKKIKILKACPNNDEAVQKDTETLNLLIRWNLDPTHKVYY